MTSSNLVGCWSAGIFQRRSKQPKKLLAPAETVRPKHIPAETAYLEFSWKPAVRSDWVVVCAVRYEPVSTSNSLLKALLQGIFVKICLFCEFAPDFCTYDQGLTGKFPINANREFLRAIRDSTPDISDLSRSIRYNSPVPLFRGALKKLR
jgi:hypothetical protein